MIQSGIFTINAQAPVETTSGDTSRFFRIQFCEPFQLQPDDKVIVIPFVQTFNGSQTPGLRIHNVDANGFDVRINEIVARTASGNNIRSDGQHVDEVIGYIATVTKCMNDPIFRDS